MPTRIAVMGRGLPAVGPLLTRAGKDGLDERARGRFYDDDFFLLDGTFPNRQDTIVRG